MIRFIMNDLLALMAWKLLIQFLDKTCMKNCKNSRNMVEYNFIGISKWVKLFNLFIKFEYFGLNFDIKLSDLAIRLT